MPKGLGGNLFENVELTPGRIIGGLIGRAVGRPRWLGMMVGQEIGYWVEKIANEILFGEISEQEEKKEEKPKKKKARTKIKKVAREIESN
jgi:hypothetical protein